MATMIIEAWRQLYREPWKPKPPPSTSVGHVAKGYRKQTCTGLRAFISLRGTHRGQFVGRTHRIRACKSTDKSVLAQKEKEQYVQGRTCSELGSRSNVPVFQAPNSCVWQSH